MNAPADKPFTMRPPPSGLHGWDDGLSAQERASQIYVHHSIPLSQRHVAQTVGREIDHDRRIVDQDVDSPEGVDRRLGHCGSGFSGAHVDADGVALAAESVGDLLRSLYVDVGNDHRCAGLREGRGIDHPNTTGSAGDDGDLAGEIEHICMGHGLD